MANTTYVDNVTVVTADTMNDLNRLHYTIFGDPADAAAVRMAIGAISVNGDIGTPASGVATNLTGTAAGLTAGSVSSVGIGAITGLGTGVNIFMGTPSSENLAAALIDKTGAGVAVFATEPEISSPVITGLLNLAQPLSGQIGFPATQNPSADPNTLDDYVEGTYSPTCTYDSGAAPNPTVSSASGAYTKIGRQVSFTAQVILSNKGSGNSIQISLPVPADIAHYAVMSVHVNNVTAGVGDTHLSATMNSTTQAGLKKMSAGSATALNSADLTNSTFIAINGTYIAT